MKFLKHLSEFEIVLTGAPAIFLFLFMFSITLAIIVSFIKGVLE